MKQWVGNAVRGKLAAPKRSCMEKNLGSLINFGSIAKKNKVKETKEILRRNFIGV